MDAPFDIVQVTSINRDTRMALRSKQLQQFFNRRVGINRDHLHPRRHHLARDLITEVHDGLDHLAFAAFENSLFLTCVDERLDFILGSFLFLRRLDLFFPSPEVVQCSHERAREGAQYKMGDLEDGKQSEKHDLRIPHRDDPGNQMAADQDHEHHQDHCAQHGGPVRNLSHLECAKQQHSSEDEQHLDDDVNRHQNLGAGFQQCG